MTRLPDPSCRRARRPGPCSGGPVRRRLAALALLALVPACAAPKPELPDDPAAARVALLGFEPDLRIGEFPFEGLEVNWKHRLDQPFVFVETLGDPQTFGDVLDRMLTATIAQGIEPAGAPFGMFYANPLDPPEGGLRMRACLPVGPGTLAEKPLRYEVLPSTVVVYAFVAGPYPEVPLAYDGLFEFIEGMGWRPTGPSREVYYVSPALVSDLSLLVTEVQIPAGPSMR